MATIIREVAIDAEPATVWDGLRDFAAVHERLAPGFVTGCHMEGPDVRAVTFVNGALARERLIGIDEHARRLAYSVIESRFNMTHHNAAAQVFDAGSGGCRFVWTADILPDEIAPVVAGLMEAGLAAIKSAFEVLG